MRGLLMAVAWLIAAIAFWNNGAVFNACVIVANVWAAASYLRERR